jgi:guanine nucleotide-binding protein G(i) subunit alpha
MKLLEISYSMSECFTEEIHESIIKIWKNKYFIKFFKQYKDSIHVPDSSEYFINKIVHLKTSDFLGYVPDSKDILYTRRKTTGIVEHTTKYDNVDIVIYDVGGQRCERKV